jgi:hypothetical protein
MENSIRQIEGMLKNSQGNSQISELTQLETIARDSGGTYRKIEDGED